MKVLITGGTGAVGSAIIARMLERDEDFEITSFVCLNAGYKCSLVCKCSCG